jgi:hypothetical protein
LTSRAARDQTHPQDAEAANHEAFDSLVDEENEAQLFQKPWDSPVSRLWRSLGTVPVFEFFEAAEHEPLGSPVDDENQTDRRGRRSHTGQIFEAEMLH